MKVAIVGSEELAIKDDQLLDIARYILANYHMICGIRSHQKNKQ